MSGKFLLTSTAIEASPTGQYTSFQTTLLIPHEVLRREFMRANKALQSMDLAKHPWKIHCFNKWYTEYFLPAIHEHHDIEEKIFFPFYSKLGCPTPNLQCDDHKAILTQLEDVKDRSVALLHLVIAGGSDNAAHIDTLTEELRNTFQSLSEHTLTHLAEEERFWTPVTEQYGEKKRTEVEKLIVNEGIAHGGQGFENFGCAIAHAMGVTSISADVYEAPLRAAGVDTHIDGWASKELQTLFMSGLPFPVRKFLMPGWNKRYFKFKAMINSCAGEVDILHVQDEVVAQGCACILS